jgi:hypothetical protein
MLNAKKHEPLKIFKISDLSHPERIQLCGDNISYDCPFMGQVLRYVYICKRCSKTCPR